MGHFLGCYPGMLWASGLRVINAYTNSFSYPSTTLLSSTVAQDDVSYIAFLLLDFEMGCYLLLTPDFY